MPADIHGGPEQKLQSEAGYIDARPQTDSSTKTPCNARPDHTFGSKAPFRPFADHFRSNPVNRHRSGWPVWCQTQTSKGCSQMDCDGSPLSVYQDRLPGIQIARAVAALAIAYLHSWHVTMPFPAGSAFPIPILKDHGALGVDLFFAISGFVICIMATSRNFNP